jgi:predicted nucleotide-binding protein (sugar kinase/HSP70/actin superfamily)
LLRRAAVEFASAMTDTAVPTVSVVGEIYVRCDPFSNDFVIEQLHDRGIRVRFAPFSEWLEYTDMLKVKDAPGLALTERAKSFIQAQIQELSYKAVASRLGWPPRTTVRQALSAGSSYIRPALRGEAILTVGGPLHDWRAGYIDGVISVGPLECLPNKIAEAQFVHVAEREGLPSLTLSLNGDPVDPEVIDRFVFDARRRFEMRGQAVAGQDH